MNPDSQNLSDVACVQTPPRLKKRGESLFPPPFFLEGRGRLYTG